MNEEHLLHDNGAMAVGHAYVQPSGYGQAFWTEEAEGHGSGQIGLALLIWIPVFVGAGVLIAASHAWVGMMLLGTAVVVHSLIQPQVAIYALIFILPIGWMVSILPGISSVSKMVGVLALFVSLRRLIPGITSGRWDPCAKWMVLFIAWAAASCLWTTYPLAGLIAWQSLVLNWGLPLLLCIHLKSRAAIRAALLVFIMSCLLGSIVIIRINDPTRIARGQERAGAQVLVGQVAEAGSGNLPSRFIAVGMFACTYFIIVSKGSFKRMLLAFAIMVMALAIILMKGRAVYVAVPCTIIGSIALHKGAGISKRALFILVIVILVGVTAFMATGFGFVGKGVQERFQSIFEEGTGAGHRSTMWMGHVNTFFKTGFRGAGFNSMRFSTESLRHVAHNDVLSIMGELGALGIILFAGFHLTLYRRLRRMEDVWAKLFCLLVWLFILLASLTQDDFTQKPYILSVGLILAMIRLDEAGRAPPEYPVWNMAAG